MSVLAELRLAVRGLMRDRAYTMLALFSLGFGIAANTVIFSLVDGVLLRPLRYKDPGRLVVINEVVPELARTYPKLPVGARHYLEWKSRLSSFSEMGLVERDRAVLSGVGDPEQVDQARVSFSLLPLLGARVRLGRLFLEEEDQPGRNGVVILTDALWSRRFARDPGVIGKSLTVDGTPVTVVGVLDSAFHLPRSEPGQLISIPSRADLYSPIALRREKLEWFGPFNYAAIGRLGPNVTVKQALAELNVLQSDIATRLPDKMHLTAVVTDLQEEVTGASRKPLLILLAAVGAVLLIVCVNLANLALARGAARSRDLAIRRALGATRIQLLRGLLIESVCLSLAGGALGVAIGWAGMTVILSQAPIDLPRLEEIHLDGRVLGFTLALSVFSGLLFGVLPAWRAAGIHPQSSLRDGSRSTTDGRGGRATRNALVAFEAALSTLLLAVAGLLMASFIQLLNVDKGFHTGELVTTQITLPPKAYVKAADRHAFLRESLDRVARIPGVSRVAIVSRLPLEGEDWVDLVRKQGDTRPTAELAPVNFRFCSPEYFRTLGVPVVAGTTFADPDRSRRVAVISEATARAVWPNENPVGQSYGRGTEDEPLVLIIGVVRDVSVGLDRQPVPTLYLPYWASNERLSTHLVLQTTASQAALAPAIRHAIWGLNRDVVIGEIRTMDAVLSSSVAGRRFQVLLTALFAGSAVLLACLGIYGVVSWSVTRRRNEIGIRMALGARREDVQRMVVGQGMQPVLAGLAIGLLAALSLGRVLSSLLFGVSPRDPWTLGAVVVTLTMVAALACYVPARRATLADPLRALRYE